MLRRLLAVVLATATLLPLPAHSAAEPVSRAGPEFVAIWTSFGAVGITPDEAAAAARGGLGAVAGVYVPAGTDVTSDRGADSALARVEAAGAAVPSTMDPALVAALRRVPADTTLRLVTSVPRAFRSKAGALGSQVNTTDPFGSGDCTGSTVVACATITIVIEMTGYTARCAFPCLPPFITLIPQVKFATTQSIDIVRSDRGIDTLSVTRNHFRSDSGDDWGHNFTRPVVSNPNQPGAGAHFVATSNGEWEPAYVELIGVGVDPEAVIISGFCMRWTVRYGATTYGSYVGGYQLRADTVVPGFFTGSQDIVQQHFCTL